MIVFATIAAVFVALVLALLLRRFYLGAAADVQPSHRKLNAGIYRDQIARLDQDVAEGTLAPGDHAQARAELERRVLEDAQAEDTVAVPKAPRHTAVVIALLLPVTATALYIVLGQPRALAPPAEVQAVAATDVERMVSGLARRLEGEPGNLKGWAMLARSYKVMGRSAESEAAFDKAGTFIDDDAAMLANYADVAASNAGGSFKGKPAALIAKALHADPNNAMALWLAGSAAMDDKDYAKAIAIWERLVGLLAPDSEDARMLHGSIAEARSRAGIGAALATARPHAAPTVPAAAVAVVAAPVAGAASVSGTVALDPSLKGRTAPGDTLMVIARVPGTRMPVAVLRVPASGVPLQFRLDDALAMSAQARISGAGEVEVEARISKSGQARAEAGDLVSDVQKVKVGARGVALKISMVRQ